MCNAIWFDVYCGELLDLGKVKLQFGKGHFRYCAGCVFFFWRVLVVGRFSKPEMFSLRGPELLDFSSSKTRTN